MSGKAAVALLLEDEPLTALVIEETLGEAGFDVTTVASGQKALEWLAVCRPDVVIVDIILRDGPCHTVVDFLVAENIPFVVHSGDHPRMHPGTAFLKGTWIGKPSNGLALVQAVRELVTA